MKRIPLRQRKLPTYSKGEEVMNMVTHIVGGAVGVAVLLAGILLARGALEKTVMVVYGGCMICLYTMSSVYHGLKPSMGKRVMQVIDHCTIYFLIAGTYMPITLIALRPVFPMLGWGLTLFQWALTALAVTLTAIDLKKYNVFSMICYIGMGWAVLPFAAQARRALGDTGFLWLLWGGIVYTVGAVLYGIGSKKKWFHSVFHIFVVLGSVLQAVCILEYVI